MGLGPAWKVGGANGEGCHGSVPESGGFGLEAAGLRSRCRQVSFSCGLSPWLKRGRLLSFAGSSLCTHVLISSYCKDITRNGVGPTLVMSF